MAWTGKMHRAYGNEWMNEWMKQLLMVLKSRQVRQALTFVLMNNCVQNSLFSILHKLGTSVSLRSHMLLNEWMKSTWEKHWINSVVISKDLWRQWTALHYTERSLCCYAQINERITETPVKRAVTNSILSDCLARLYIISMCASSVYYKANEEYLFVSWVVLFYYVTKVLNFSLSLSLFV